MMPIARPLLTLVLVLSGPFARAQFRDMWGTGWNTPVSASIGSSIYWKTMMQTPRGSSSNKAAPAPAAAAPKRGWRDSRRA